MALKVICYSFPESRRSVLCAAAMSAGISKLGDHVELKNSRHYTTPEADVAVFYGLSKPMLNDYSRPPHRAVFIDLGYWAREGQEGSHKITVNSRHPTAYFQRKAHEPSRFSRLGLRIAPWRGSGRSIMVVGMSGKAANAQGFQPEEWERQTVAALRTITKRPIVYRPKPNWKGSTQIEGAEHQQGDQQGTDVAQKLRDVFCVVTHHSNVAVDALLMGVPVLSIEGIASVLSTKSLEKVDTPLRPEGREQWAYDAAYTQWTVSEMRTGSPWRHLKEEGLIP